LSGIQREFHRRADAKRFRNRLDNPFLRPKERRLALLIGGQLPPGGGRMLEVGCGEGSNLSYLRRVQPQARLIGLDFSIQKVAFMKEQLAAVAACGEADRLPFRDASFDLVLCRDLLHHVNRARDGVMSESFRVLRPHGRLVVVESDGRAMLNRIFRALVPAEKGMRDSTPDKLMTLGRRFGRTRLDYIEAGLMLRALAFPLGWPKGWARFLVAPVYLAALAWEWFFRWAVPKNRWSYMMMVVERDRS